MSVSPPSHLPLCVGKHFINRFVKELPTLDDLRELRQHHEWSAYVRRPEVMKLVPWMKMFYEEPLEILRLYEEEFNASVAANNPEAELLNAVKVLFSRQGDRSRAILTLQVSENTSVCFSEYFAGLHHVFNLLVRRDSLRENYVFGLQKMIGNRSGDLIVSWAKGHLIFVNIIQTFLPFMEDRSQVLSIISEVIPLLCKRGYCRQAACTPLPHGAVLVYNTPNMVCSKFCLALYEAEKAIEEAFSEEEEDDDADPDAWVNSDEGSLTPISIESDRS